MFLIFAGKIAIDISCKLSPYETICMTCQILFPGKKKSHEYLSSAEFAHTVLKFIKIICNQSSSKRSMKR